MATNEPIPINIYTRTETDLKLENLEQRIGSRMDQRFDQIMAEFKLLRTELTSELGHIRAEIHHTQTEFKGELNLVRQELNMVRWFTGGLLVIAASFLLTVLGKYFHWV